MSQPREFHGFAFPDGRSTLDHPAMWKAFVKYLAGTDGEEITITAHKRRSKRSNKQNAYWWGVVIPLLAEEIGYTHDEMHEALKAKFLSKYDAERDLMKVGSTAKLSTGEFTELMDAVMLWAAEKVGVVLPLPEVDRKQAKKAA